MASSRSPEAPIEIVPYDASWPRLFAQERELLAQALAKWIVGGIEHVGSTAVPGLDAKPVIDIMMGVQDLDSSRSAIPAAERLGYSYAAYRQDVMHWFCKPSRAFRTHHLHLVPFQDRKWMERVAFRDYLRSHPETAAAYAELKRSLAVRFQFDREKYTKEKGPFIENILQLAIKDQRLTTNDQQPTTND
jgi:GrpB-like predicted nucleotidyltransferase (UPF0157 family)